jgi:hypothetical protein
MFRQVTMAFGSEVLFIVICLITEDFRNEKSSILFFAEKNPMGRQERSFACSVFHQIQLSSYLV